MTAIRRWSAVIPLVAILAPPLMGQAPQRSPGELVRSLVQLDADGDRAITSGEVPESARDAFEVLLRHGDTDANGQLAEEELRSLLERIRSGTGGPEAIARRFDRADRDGDGHVSRAEFPGPAALFDRLDADRDGQLTREEAEANPRAASPAPPPPADPKAATDAPSGPMARRLLRLDADGDGRVTREEYRGPPGLFGRMDRDGNGTIDSNELKESPRP